MFGAGSCGIGFGCKLWGWDEVGTLNPKAQASGSVALGRRGGG